MADYPVEVDTFAPRDITIQTGDDKISATFNSSGLLKSISTETIGNHPVHLEFMTYKARDTSQTSGAYIFLPDDVAQPLTITDPVVLVSTGLLESSCAVAFQYMQHEVVVRAGERALEIRNLVDIHQTSNTELVMRLSTSIDSKDQFYTDLNGFQFMKRKRFDKIPLQGNYYPIPSGIFIEDGKTRLTLLTAQPLGGSSLAAGEIEIMQDRRLDQDDKRGLATGVEDNQPTLNSFRLGLEEIGSCARRPENYAVGFLTESMQTEMNQLLHPLGKLIWRDISDWNGVLANFGGDHESLDVGTEIAALRSLKYVRSSKKNRKPAIGMIVNRYHLEQCDGNQAKNEKVNLLHVLGIKKNVDVFNTALTMLVRKGKLDTPSIDICPMEIKAFIIDR